MAATVLLSAEWVHHFGSLQSALSAKGSLEKVVEWGDDNA